MESHSIVLAPFDSRCRYWARVVRADQDLPLPRAVASGLDIPGRALRRGDEELLPCDAVFEGEANHHIRKDFGWSYRLTVVDAEGELHRFDGNFGAQKAQMKAQGMAPELLQGSGDIAAMVRIVHGLRAGLKVTPNE